jgi:excisionase family DNA binding protein
MKKKYLSTIELAKILDISRVAVLKKIKLGQIKAIRVGRNYAISVKDLGGILGEELTKKDKAMINRVVKRTVKEYGETLRLLGAS